MELQQEEEEAFQLFTALHGAALQASRIPPLYWKSLHSKLVNEVFDAGEVFGIMQVEEVEEEVDDLEEGKELNPGTELSYKVIVTHENGLQAADPNSIFLIDHAWVYRIDHARQQLRDIPGLFVRMANLMGVDFHGELPEEEDIDQVMEEMWKYNQTYQLSQGTAEEKVPVWYIMDEFGSQIQHSDEPTFHTAPFFYMPSQTAFTILWPLRDLENGEEVTRDYAYGEPSPSIRKCMLLPWKNVDLREVSSYIPEPADSYYQAIFTESKEILPCVIDPPTYPKNKIFKVYAEVKEVVEFLKHPQFTITEKEEEADILYMFSHIKNYWVLGKERPQVMVNQFPCENLVTVKDCLASVARRAENETEPKWLPRSFNLRTELPQFVSYYQQRERRGEDNHWICKPWNLARGLDTHITSNLSYIIRQRESTPKVVCKYIENPVLFNRNDIGMVKFDVRYIVLLRSLHPLKLYAYDVFWLRFANRPFSLDHFDDNQKHFTVMNYAQDVQLKQIHYDEFIPLFEAQYPDYKWCEVQKKTFKAIAELFQKASSRPPPFGIYNYPSSRAVYAIDLMLSWSIKDDGTREMQPQLLEVNFNPDCHRACKYHPSFYDDIFSTLFLDDSANRPVTLL
ncbi:tubulin--tyrosine ligase-like protein 12 isoform X1 [Latimeria chalumnae]|uniref:tubulin--tyrosine ligase-like protein 12 isoform X1 n=2 Tax=Latimeria chalumnae TaxID=7897 RepID=UPI0006D924D8|nr:PREDICTED: tubulin--tyrosine ligase-like protein 12 [Latimeria chalumnae]|eukprot:XP_014342704.1 PREDICTED: tubulin--tyrosine ligase-like protein 12 [Latimeria chalumnae]